MTDELPQLVAEEKRLHSDFNDLNLGWVSGTGRELVPDFLRLCRAYDCCRVSNSEVPPEGDSSDT